MNPEISALRERLVRIERRKSSASWLTGQRSHPLDGSRGSGATISPDNGPEMLVWRPRSRGMPGSGGAKRRRICGA